MILDKSPPVHPRGNPQQILIEAKADNDESKPCSGGRTDSSDSSTIWASEIQSGAMNEFMLTPAILVNLTGADVVSKLARFNEPMSFVLVLFEFASPVSVVLNLFVFVSCVIILVRKSSDRPALVFIAYNSILDMFTTVADAIVLTGAVNPSIAADPVLPTTHQLTQRCATEKAMVTFTMFSSLSSVLLLTSDRFIFITRPLTYNVIMTLPRAIVLVTVATLLSVGGALWYSLSVTLPWDRICTFTHVLPLSLVIFWNAFFFATWISMHAMYLVILVIALRHRKAISASNSSLGRTIRESTTRIRPEGAPTGRWSEGVSSNPSPSSAGSISDSWDSGGLMQRSLSNIRVRLSLSPDNPTQQNRRRLTTIFKTIRYVVLLLLIYSLVEVPCVAVAIDDILTHMHAHDDLGNGSWMRCGHSDGREPLPSADETAISLLQCMQRFVGRSHSSCTFLTKVESLDMLPWCHMLKEMTHSLQLTRVFTLALLGWIVNALADPIVYAFWYPVFRKNLVKVIFKIRDRSNWNAASTRIAAEAHGDNNATSQPPQDQGQVTTSSEADAGHL